MSTDTVTSQSKPRRTIIAPATRSPTTSAQRHALGIIRTICAAAGSSTLLEETRWEFRNRGLADAILGNKTDALFNWLIEMFNYQGISDKVAFEYLQKHGSVSWHDVETAMGNSPTCPLLTGHLTFQGCGYDKTGFCCSEPEHIDKCPLPTHRLRNGRLNQTAYSLFLFIRDIAAGDLVSWIDRQIGSALLSQLDAKAAADNLVAPLRQVFGVSDKILSMSLSTMMMGAGHLRPKWPAVGAQMIAIDTLVHNFLHRTGILQRFDASHAYGAGCYAAGGCAEIIRMVSARIDASQFNEAYPANFPRFVQFAIWRFCSGGGYGLDICNGNAINDAEPCQNTGCQAFKVCDRKALKTSKITQ